jgi:hypothetical protein
VADIFAYLVELGVLTKDSSVFGCLKSLDDQWTFEPPQQISTELNDPRLTVHIRDRTSTRIQIFVRLCSSKPITISVSPDDSVELLKSKVLSYSGFPVAQQRLIFAGRELRDGGILSDYYIRNHSTVFLLTRMKGGKPIIRLASTTNDMIPNVTVRLDLPCNVWHLSSVYPTPSNTDQMSFVEWNNIQVHPNGQLCFEKPHSIDHYADHIFPSINDEHEYRMLFWEALSNKGLSVFNLDKYLCVPRHDFSRVLNYLLKKMSFASEDRDDMITYVLPHLDEADPDYERKNIIFRFLSEDEYSTVAPLYIRPVPERMVRAFLLYGFGDDEEQVSNIHEIDQIVSLVIKEYVSTSELVVHEWGSMFVH